MKIPTDGKRGRAACLLAALVTVLVSATCATAPACAEEATAPRDITYPKMPPAPPLGQDASAARAKSEACLACHAYGSGGAPRDGASARGAFVDQATMHANPAVVLGCADCHGGNAAVHVPSQIAALARTAGACRASAECKAVLDQAHVRPLYPEAWDWPSSRMPERTYTLLNYESPEMIRFLNPGDNRVAREACGACHAEIVDAVQRSLMSDTAMLWGGAAYNNGIVPFKRYILGEGYFTCSDSWLEDPRLGDAERAEARRACEDYAPQRTLPARFAAPPDAGEASGVPSGSAREEMARRGIVPSLAPLPRWETVPPADNFRVFERGGRFIRSQFPEIGLPNPLEDPGRPDIRQSNRGPGTGSRISVPVLNIHKTRLNDPTLWFLGTSDHPGDYRSSGCTACHTPYANDREWRHSGPLAAYGNMGESETADPTIPHGEPGHPLRHAFTRGVPTAQCMVCHMHQPNMFVNSYLGFTMWDYEPDAPLMWPEKQFHPTPAERHAALEANPEAAVARGKWRDLDFLRNVWTDVNPRATATQFADYHGHGWNFRAIYKRSRDGTLLDAEGRPVADDDPKKFAKAVHLRDIHAERGMQCADCHFAQDAHGRGTLDQEVAAGVEIRCVDCHGSAEARATLRTSGPAAPPGGHDLSFLRNPDGRQRFVWRDGKLYQRPIMGWDPSDPDGCKRHGLGAECEWPVSQVIDSIDPTNRAAYNPRAARAKMMWRGTSADSQARWRRDGLPPRSARAHDDQQMACFACHSSWMTGCAGCHLPVEANEKTERNHYEGGETRNFATYNPQVARDDFYILGRHGDVKQNIIAPVRSSSALVLSSTDINRNRIYVQQPPISAAGFSAQAFAPHFPHTVRKTETKACDDCHLSASGDNNAIMAQLLGLGTSFVSFLGLNAWVGTSDSIEAVQVTEWQEPQAVIGSYLQRYAYPDDYAAHVAGGRELAGEETTGGKYSHAARDVRCLQQRGEYLYVAEGEAGVTVYDVASVANKNFSARVVTAPFSPLGQDIHIPTADATCVTLPTNQPIRPDRNQPASPEMERLMRVENREQVMHPVYRYAAITDSKEGLILTNVVTMSDFEPRNNFLQRDVVWNPDGLLDGATYAVFAGHLLYVAAARGVVVVDLDDPLHPHHLATIPLVGTRAFALQFRYLFVVDGEGMRVVDVTDPAAPRLVEGAFVALADAHRVSVARTYAYVAAGAQGLVIVDVERPEKPRLLTTFTGGGVITDARDVVVASTNASLFAYVADGAAGLAVVQLTSPASQPKFYGFSPEPRPELIAWRRTDGAALSLSRPLERDRAVDETGHQVAIFGRVGARPFTLEEMRRFFEDPTRKPWFVSRQPEP